MAGPQVTSLLGVGLYSIPEAACLAQVPAASIRRWLFGYSYQRDDQRHELPPVVTHEIEAGSRYRFVTFHDLIEIQFVHAFRVHGVSWKHLRLASAKARNLLHTSHPFSTQQFSTDGREIFAEIAHGTSERALLSLAREQYVFRAVIQPSLRAALEYQNGDLARWWPLGPRNKTIVVDPDRQFGRPIVAGAGVPTAVLARASRAYGSASRVAAWFDVHPKAVRAAVAFEQRLAA
jgi:uncharacterized protein (DUF433 family)